MRAFTDAFRLLPVAALAVAGARAQDPVSVVDPGTGTVAATLIVSGTVQRATPDEDLPLPTDLRIFIDCHHGDYFDGGGTSQSGQFRFTMTPDPQAISSSSICVAEAKAFGFDSSIARFPVRSSSGVVNIGVLTIERNASGNAQAQNKERTGKTVSASSLKAPPSAVKAFERGLHLLQQGKYADAAKDFESAIKIYPEYAESWLNLGRARASLDAVGPAREAFLRAAQLDPQMAEPPAELGLLAARENDLAGAAKYLDESLRLDPAGSFQACYSDALVNLVLKRYDVAERSARAALTFGDSGPHARVNFILGMALLARGNNSEAKQHLLRYLDLAPKAAEREQVLRELSRLDRLESGK